MLHQLNEFLRKGKITLSDLIHCLNAKIRGEHLRFANILHIFMTRLLFSLLFICGSSFSFCWADLASDSIYLTWQRDPTTTMTIQWISLPENSNKLVSYRQKNSSTWETATAAATPLSKTLPLQLYRAELVQLEPFTDYVFKCADQELCFRTMPTTLTSPLRFIEGGDMYQENIEAFIEMNQRAALTSPDFAVLGGDIAYAVGKRHFEDIQRWVDWIVAWHKSMVTPEKRMIPVMAAIGNHDLVGQYDQRPTQARVFSLLFPMPGPQIYNVLDFGNYLSLLLLDSGHATSIKGAQAAWLQSALAGRRDVLYRFAIYHVPAYPSVRSFNSYRSKLIRHTWVPIFEKEQLDLAFEHHDHAYKRTYPLLRNKNDPRGVIYLGDGAWGVPPRETSSGPARHYLAQFIPVNHFIQVDLAIDQFKVTAIDLHGNIIDSFMRKRTFVRP